MRHWLGLVFALALAAALFFGGGWGATHVSSITAGGHGLLMAPGHLSRAGQLALAGLAAIAVAVGVLITVPVFSPLAAGLPGLAGLAWTGFLAADYHRAVSLVPLQADAYGAGFRAMLTTGVLGLAGFAMIVPLFVPSRWRRWPDGLDDDAFTVNDLMN